MQTPSILFVCLMGMGIVFIGLILLVLITMLSSFIIRKTEKKAVEAPAAAPADEPIKNRGEFVAAVSAVIAEQIGTDADAIRIKNIKKV